jgi:BlaI family transcriptional regulator, penicillinase repressor
LLFDESVDKDFSMSRPTSQFLTERESQLMDVLWARGPCTAEDVRDTLADHPHDSTVRTLLRVLKQKGYVRIRGRQPAIYEAKVVREVAQSKATVSLLSRFFGGSAEALVMSLLENEQLSPDHLDQLRKSLARRNRGRGNS